MLSSCENHLCNENVTNCLQALAYGKKIIDANDIQKSPHFRLDAVSLLCKRETLSADAVVPVPHAGVFLAACWDEQRADEVLWPALGLKKFGTSMYNVPNDENKRVCHARLKTYKKIEGYVPKKVFLIDEGILSGISMITAIETLRNNGVKEIYARTILPPFVNSCPYSCVKYIPTVNNVDNIAKFLGADDYAYLSVEDLMDIGKGTHGKDANLCHECLR